MNRTRSTALALLTVLVAGATARAQATGGVAGVRDGAGMFSEGAVKEADDALKDVRRKTHWSALVETVETLNGKTVKDAAIDNAKALQEHGLYLLIAKKEHKFYAEPSKSAMKAFDHDAITKLEAAITQAFKAGKFDQGLLDAVALIRHDAEAAPDAAPTPTPATAATPPPPPQPANNTSVAATKPDMPAPAPKPAKKTVTAEKPDVTPPAPKPAVPVLPRPTPVPVATTNEPAPNGERAAAVSGSMLPILVVGGVAVLLVLWLLSRAFRGGSQAPQTYSQPGPTVHYGPGVVPTPAPGPGYAPQPPVRPVYPTPPQRPGYGPPPQPGYAPPPQPGYAIPPQTAYGYAPPPPQHGGGGGFISGVLGGAAGAVAGNILYDKFGRPHEGQGTPTHVPGGVVVPPHQGASWPQGANAPAPVPPAETYDPNAGGGGDWGTPDPSTQPAADVDADASAGGDWGSPEPAADADAGAGGDWGTPEPVADAGGGGDWGTPEPAPEPEAPADTGGDWGAPDEPADTGGGGGDWGGADPGTDDNQGGSW